MSRVVFKKLTLTNFRNYGEAQLRLDGRAVVLTGPNGAGKTNVLEALSMLSPGRGLRGARLDELTRHDDGLAPQTNKRHWAVSAVLERGTEEVRLGTGLDPAQEAAKRIVRVDGQNASGPGVLASYFSLVWLTPALDRLFAEGAGQRRRFLDRLVLGLDPHHSSVVSAFDKAARERQRLLDDAADGGRLDEAWAGALEARMGEAGVALSVARLDLVRRLGEEIKGGQASAFPRAGLCLTGAFEKVLSDGRSALEAEDWYVSELKRRRREDARAGRALLSPNRSDLEVTFGDVTYGAGARTEVRAGGRAARTCSTGEQKALLVGIVLANARLKRSLAGGAPPILLLDEIAAHLDEQRRAALFDELEALQAQAFMTGTDRVLFEAMGARAQYLEIANGCVTLRPSN